jgi:type IV secretion system protein VirB9
LKTTTIEFGPDEQIVGDPAWGENIRWSFDTDGANHLYVKPNGPGLVNTLSVNTNKRSYEFTLVSSPLGGIFYQKVRFRVQAIRRQAKGARRAVGGAGRARRRRGAARCGRGVPRQAELRLWRVGQREFQARDGV